MNHIQNQYISSLLIFDQKTHYLAINDRDQLVVRSKSDLGRVSRFIRYFWKPQTERISFVTRRIFANVGKEVSEKLNHDYSKLTIVFKNLRILSKKADQKLKQTTYSDILFPMQNENFSRQGIKNKMAVDHAEIMAAYEAQVQNVLDGCHKKVEDQNQKIAHEIQIFNQMYEQRVQLNKKLKSKSEALIKIKATIEESSQEAEVLLEQVKNLREAFKAHKKAVDEALLLKNDISKRIDVLRDKEKVLDFNMVLWTDDGYVLCSTDLLDEKSPFMTDTAKNLRKKSENGRNVIEMIYRDDPEMNKALNAIKRCFYLPDYKIKHVKMLVNVLEQKTDYIQKGTEEDLAAVKRLADYLLIKVEDRQLLDYEVALANNQKLLIEKQNEIVQLRNRSWQAQDGERGRNNPMSTAHIEALLDSLDKSAFGTLHRK